MVESIEEALSGGNVSDGLVRIGDTVRRPTGPWTPAVHSLLRHLESVGFDGAPRVLGIDESGREILEYIPGVVPWRSTHYQYLGTDEAMGQAGQLLRAFHDASRRFEPPPDAEWRSREDGDALAWLDERGTIICHNDATAWNLVVSPERWAFIDWDFAGPQPFIWDVAYALIGLLPIAPDPSGLGWSTPVPLGQRLRAFVDGYGLEERDRKRFVDVVVARIESSYAHLRAESQAGVEPWATLWKEGHGVGWAEMLSYAREHRDEWHKAAIR